MLETIAQQIKKSKKALIVTGAGMSADAGVPTYRGKGGIYNNPTEDRMRIEDCISLKTFKENPALSWKYYQRQISITQKAKPHSGYYALNKILKNIPEVFIFTQNVDGLHKKSGLSAYEMHGNHDFLICQSCEEKMIMPKAEDIDIPPKCSCGEYLRPSSVMFGESISDVYMKKLDSVITAKPDLLIGIGSSFSFNYLKYPFILANQSHNLSVDINPQKSYISHLVQYHIKEKAQAGLEQLVKFF